MRPARASGLRFISAVLAFVAIALVLPVHAALAQAPPPPPPKAAPSALPPPPAQPPAPPAAPASPAPSAAPASTSPATAPPAPPPPAGAAPAQPYPPPAGAPPGAYPYYPYPYPYYYPPPPPPPLRFDSEAEIPPEEDGPLAPKDRPARLERPGKILVGVGLAVAAVGGLLIAHGATGATNFEEPVFFTFGAGLLVMGGVATAVGIPLWVIGASRSNR